VGKGGQKGTALDKSREIFLRNGRGTSRKEKMLVSITLRDCLNALENKEGGKKVTVEVLSSQLKGAQQREVICALPWESIIMPQETLQKRRKQ